MKHIRKGFVNKGPVNFPENPAEFKKPFMASSTKRPTQMTLPLKPR